MSFNVLVTGGAGFIGSSLIDRLLKLGHSVVCIDNFNNYYDPKIKLNNIRNAKRFQNFKLYECDIENYEKLDQIFYANKIDAVVHLAARAGVRPSIDNPVSYMKTNVIGTTNILELVAKYKVSKTCIASSSSVYGNAKSPMFKENLNVHKPISPYAASKLSCELLAYTYHHIYNQNIIMLRFFTVYGPRQRPDLAINKFVSNIINNIPIEMYGDGSSVRDYTYIDDIVNGIIESLFSRVKGFEIINLGGGSPISLIDMIHSIEECLGKKAIIHKLPMQTGDVMKTVCDNSKAQRLLGYKPKTDFKTGIEKFIEWRKLNV